LLLGTISILNWGNPACGWWCFLTDERIGGTSPKLDVDAIEQILIKLKALPDAVARKVHSALYWVRSSRPTLQAQTSSDIFRYFAGYWNAFECLVDAVSLVRPRDKLAKAAKTTAINAFLLERGGTLDADSLSQCYRTYVDPGFAAKATHVLHVCFGDKGARYAHQCFRVKPERDRLYSIRNAINHGDLDIADPNEHFRVHSHHSLLTIIVLGILGRLLPFPVPVDPD
jgi:hypothetical protein